MSIPVTTARIVSSGEACLGMDTATSAKDRASIAGFEVIKTASIAAYNGQAASGSGQLLVGAVDPVH